MLSIPDMALLGVAALMLFGPEQLPRVARKAGNVMRDIQNTSQSFIREMERAADLQDEAAVAKGSEVTPYDPVPYEAQPYEAPGEPMGAADGETLAEADQAEAASTVGEKLAEPRPAPGLEASAAAEPAPQAEHAPHL
jgi:Sec-independent protein translocase protein TatA